MIRYRAATLVTVLWLCACSGEEPLNSATATREHGALLVTESVSVSIPVGAVTEPVEIALTRQPDGVEDAASAVYGLGPADLELLQPALIAIVVEDPSQALTIARLLDDGRLEALDDPSVDRVASEVRGRTRQLGRFVAVPAALATVPTAPRDAAEPAGSTFFGATGAQSAPVSPIDGHWEGTGTAEGYRLQVSNGAFRLERDGEQLRSGSLTIQDTRLELLDDSGSVESGTFALASGTLTLETNSGLTTWQPAAQGAVDGAADEPDPGFFAARDTDATAAPATNTPSPPPAAAAVPPPAAAPVAPPPAPAASAEVSPPETADKPRGFWRNLGSSIRQAGKKTVSVVSKPIERLKGGADQAADAADGALPDSLGLGGGERPACELVSVDEASSVLGAPVRRQDFGSEDLCRYLADGGSYVDVRTDWNTGQSPDPVPRMIKLGHCQALPGLSKDACSRTMSSGMSRVFLSRGTTSITVEVLAVGGDSAAAVSQVAGWVADRF